MLFLNSRSLCLHCISNLSIAYCNLSFFCCSRFISSIFESLNVAEEVDSVLREGCAPPPKLEFRRLFVFSRPFKSSDRALRLSSFRASWSMCLSAVETNWCIAGTISSTRDCWASRRVGSARSSKCCWVWRTLQRRGKSDTPSSRIDMLESRSDREERKEDTAGPRDAISDVREDEVVIDLVWTIEDVVK